MAVVYEDETFLKRVFWFLVAGAMLTLGSGVLVSWIIGVNLDPVSWSVFINAKLPLIWTQTTTALLAVYAIDLITPGRTIAVIMDLSEGKDTWQNRAVACAFLLGIGFIAAITVKGGF